MDIELRPIQEELSPALTKSSASHEQLNAASTAYKVITPTVHSTRPSYLRVGSVVSFYIVTSISMIMINKLVLKQVGLPITFLWGQLVLAAIVLRSASFMRLLTLPTARSWSLLQSIAPLIVMNVVGLVLNTLCLHHIDAVLYQVARSLILPITVALSPILGQRISFSAMACCVFISIGFFIGIFGESSGPAQISYFRCHLWGPQAV